MANRTEAGISVIMPLYNKRDTVVRAISSILRQEGVEKEIIVVDDGSTDDSAEQIKVFGDKVIYVKQENQGPSAARNRGAKLSKFNRLVFLDADDELTDGCLAAHAACRVITPEIEVSLASFRVKNGKSILREEVLTERLIGVPIEQGFACLDRFVSAVVVNIASGSICVNKDLFESVGRFDPELRCWEITDLMYRLTLQRPKIGVLQGFYVTIYDDKASGHFEKLRSDPIYLTRFADKLLDRIPEVPEDQRGLVFGKIAIILNYLVSPKNARAFKRIAERACDYPMFVERTNGLCFFSKRSVCAIKFSFYFGRRKYQKMLHPSIKGLHAKKCAE